jgi:nicotinate-nucleotide adenylyltransferase
MPAIKRPSDKYTQQIARSNAARWRGLRVGLLGGSFNPAHRGHRLISLIAMKQLKLDAVWWLVSPQNPLKSPLGMASQAARLEEAWAISNHPAIFPTGIESRIGTRYTVDTLQTLTAHFPQTDFIWLMGADSLAGFHQWRDWQAIAALLPIAVFLRPGYTNARWSAPAMAKLGTVRRRQTSAKNWAAWETPALVMINLPMDGTSATALRKQRPGWASPRHASLPAALPPHSKP